MTTGYFQDPEATAAAMAPGGWFRTGDIARMDAEGYVYILDRKKDMITRGGNKIFSAELEQLLLAHPDIVDAAVVGVPDPLAFEAVAAYVVARPHAEMSAAVVQQWVRAGMADYAAPRFVHLVDEIPRNSIGKVDKPHLRKMAADAAARR